MVEEKFLIDLDIDEKIYERRYVGYFESKGKHFIHFEDNTILELSDEEEKTENNQGKDESEGNEDNNKNNNKEKNDNNEEKDNETEENEENIFLKSLILLFDNMKQFQKMFNCDMVFNYLNRVKKKGKSPTPMIDPNTRTDYAKMRNSSR